MRFFGVTFQSLLLRRQILSLSMYPLQRHLELSIIALIESLVPEPTRKNHGILASCLLKFFE